MRILIADDSIVTRHLLEATLRKWGYEVVVANDGNEAWKALQGETAPRIAILDWVMPGLTGPEVCKRVREHSRDSEGAYTYLLLLTSKSQREDLIEGMESGADDYLTKPFDNHELKVRLRAGTRIIDLQRELLAAREELREQATKDFLTRLWNRSSRILSPHAQLHASLRRDRPLRWRGIPHRAPRLRRTLHRQPGRADAGRAGERAHDDQRYSQTLHCELRRNKLAAGYSSECGELDSYCRQRPVHGEESGAKSSGHVALRPCFARSGGRDHLITASLRPAPASAPSASFASTPPTGTQAESPESLRTSQANGCRISPAGSNAPLREP